MTTTMTMMIDRVRPLLFSTLFLLSLGSGCLVDPAMHDLPGDDLDLAAPPDLATPQDAAGVDVPAPDMSTTTPPDMSPPPPDMVTTPDMAPPAPLAVCKKGDDRCFCEDGVCQCLGDCDLECEQGTCDIQCPSGDTTCDTRCESGTDCEVRCATEDGTCEVDCQEGARCLLWCGEADDDGNCEFDKCHGPDGDGGTRCEDGTLVCNRPCPETD